MRHCQMTIIEFQEALARISDKLSLLPITPENELMDLVERRLQPLHIKLDYVITTLYERLKDQISQ